MPHYPYLGRLELPNLTLPPVRSRSPTSRTSSTTTEHSSATCLSSCSAPPSFRQLTQHNVPRNIDSFAPQSAGDRTGKVVGQAAAGADRALLHLHLPEVWWRSATAAKAGSQGGGESRRQSVNVGLIFSHKPTPPSPGCDLSIPLIATGEVPACCTSKYQRCRACRTECLWFLKHDVFL